MESSTVVFVLTTIVAAPFGAVALVLMLIWLAAVPAAVQERKIWLSRGVPNLTVVGWIKVYLMNVVWMSLCLLGSVATVLYCAFLAVAGKSEQHIARVRRNMAHNGVERGVAKFIAYNMLAPVVIKGKENIPEDRSAVPAPVYVANHASQMDVAVVYTLDVAWRWIAKSSIIYLPGVGQIMWLSNHVFIDRKKKSSSSNKGTSARNLYAQSNQSIQEGVPMFFFPQGTRRMVERLPFKDGAFKIAIENESDIIPISLDVPANGWNTLYPFQTDVAPIVITIHPPITVKKTYDLDKLKQKTYDTIYGVLPDYRTVDRGSKKED